MVLGERNGMSLVVMGGMEEPYDHALRSFIREAVILNELKNHPNIVKVFFYCEENDTAYYGMELLKGQSLRNRLRDGATPITALEAFKMVMPIMDALQFTHDNNVLHRDISPNNIFLCDAPDKPGCVIPKLIDFGAAYAAIAHLTQTFELTQTNGYTPVEQLLFGKAEQGPWVDVYSLCATLYYCLTLKSPPPSMEIYKGSVSLVPPSKMGASIPPGAEAVLLGGMESQYRNRIQTIKELRRELGRALGVDEPSPEPDKPLGRLECVAGASKGKHWALQDRMVIGRYSKKSQIVLPDSMISRTHCVIECYRGSETAGFTITDLGSTNGTYLNQIRIPANQPVLMEAGMLLTVGGHKLVFITPDKK